MLPAVLVGGCVRAPTARPADVLPEARALYLRARRLAERREYERAVELLRDAIRLSPRFVEAHRLYQQTSLAQGEAEAMLAEYGAMAAEHPDDPVAAYLYGRLQLSMRAAEKLFKKAAHLDPGFPWPHYGIGIFRLRQNKLGPAAVNIEKAVRLSGRKEATMLLGLAEVRTRRREYEAALDLCLEASSLDPEDASPDLLTAEIEERRKKFPAALSACEDALKKNPHSRTAAAMHRRLLDRHGGPEDFARSVELYRRLLASAEDAPGLWGNLGHALLKMKRWGEARRSLERGRALGLSPADYANDLRLLNVARQKYSEALAAWEEKAGRDLLLADGNLLRPRFERLYADSWKAEERPADAKARLRLAESYAEVGWNEEAELTYGAALKLDPDLAPARRGLDALKRHLAFRRRLREVLESQYIRSAAGGKPASFAAVLEMINRAAEETLGRRFEMTHVRSYPFIGKAMFSTGAPSAGLLKYFYDHGQFFVMGKTGSGPVEAVLMNLISWEPHKRFVIWGHEVKCARLLVGRAFITSRSHFIEREKAAGRTLEGIYYVDVDELWRSAAEDREICRKRIEPMPRAPAMQERDAKSLYRISSLYQRMIRKAAAARPDARSYFDAMLSVVDWHELGHVVDAQAYFPVGRHLLRDIGLILERGFSRRKLLGMTERNAQLTAIAHAEAGDVAFAFAFAYLAPGADGTPHAAGSYELNRAFIKRIRGQDNGGVPLLDRIGALSVEQARRIACDIAREYGLPKYAAECSAKR